MAYLFSWRRDLRPQALTGSKMEKLCDKVHITLNKNAVQGDRSAMSPGGVRVGTPALTTRGMKEPEFRLIADFMARAADLAIGIQQTSGKLLKDFTIAMEVGRVAQTVWFIIGFINSIFGVVQNTVGGGGRFHSQNTLGGPDFFHAVQLPCGERRRER